MPQFLAALMALLASFTHDGKPATIPPQIGSQVFFMVMGGSQVGTQKVSADNIQAGIQMPTSIPQVAMDHSPPLSPSSGILLLPQDKPQGNQSDHAGAYLSAHGNGGQSS